MFKKKFLMLLITLVILGSNGSGFAIANPFSDVPAGHWAYNAVVSLAAKGTFNGYGDGTFKGDRNITRYEAATILAKLTGIETQKSNSGQKLKFTDVPEKHWAYKYVSFTAEKGINKGYDDNTFRGDRYITRYEMAHMIASILELNTDSKKNANPFSDVASSHWAVNSVINLAVNGIIEGYGNGTFKGDKNITRYEAAHMVAKAEVMRENN